MRSYDCAPVSQPALPPTHQHPMWQAWDLAVDIAVSQLPDILEKGATYKVRKSLVSIPEPNFNYELKEIKNMFLNILQEISNKHYSNNF
jgi:hypothetical protein